VLRKAEGSTTKKSKKQFNVFNYLMAASRGSRVIPYGK